MVISDGIDRYGREIGVAAFVRFLIYCFSATRFESNPSSSESEEDSEAEGKSKHKEKEKKKKSPEKKRKAEKPKSPAPKKKAKISVGITDKTTSFTKRCFMRNVVVQLRIRKGHGRPGKLWNFTISFSRPVVTFKYGSWNCLEIFDEPGSSVRMLCF